MKTKFKGALALTALAGATWGFIVPGTAQADHLTGEPVVVLGDYEPDGPPATSFDEFTGGWTDDEDYACAGAGCITGEAPIGLALVGGTVNATQDDRSVELIEIDFTLEHDSVVESFLSRFGAETARLAISDADGEIDSVEELGAGEGVHQNVVLSTLLASGTYTLTITLSSSPEDGDNYFAIDQIAISADRVVDCGGYLTESEAEADGYTVLYVVGDGDGTSGPDLIVGSDEANVINAGAGADIVCANGGDDEVNGEDGADSIEGGEGDDLLRGGNGADSLSGGAGDDDLRGNRGKDKLTGGAGDDELRGGRHADNLTGSAGDDFLDGGLGKDKGNGSAGFDTCVDIEKDVGQGCEA